MNDHQYYRKGNDTLKSMPKELTCYIGGKEFKFITDSGVFSKDYLDYATRILLENVSIETGKDLLDLGCGYGPIGIYYAKEFQANVTMVDINERAVKRALDNVKLNQVNASILESDGFENVLEMKFDYIISNPPIRAGKAVIYKMFEDSKDHLNKDGKFIIVIQEHHGAKSAIKKLKEIYSKVDVIYKKKGYYLIESSC